MNYDLIQEVVALEHVLSECEALPQGEELPQAANSREAALSMLTERYGESHEEVEVFLDGQIDPSFNFQKLIK